MRNRRETLNPQVESLPVTASITTPHMWMCRGVTRLVLVEQRPMLIPFAFWVSIPQRTERMTYEVGLS
jgi:hypothetical protein